MSAMLLALACSAVSAASNPNLNGCWQLYRASGAYNDAWQITSGTSTSLTGYSETSNVVSGGSGGCDGVYGDLSGSISDGGQVLESDEGGYGWAYVITSVSATTMTLWSYYEFGGGYGSPPAAPSSYSECEQEQQANMGNPYSGWYCQELTAINLTPQAPPQHTVSGHVYQEACSEVEANRSCVQSGRSGVTILVTGSTGDGAAVNQTAVSKSDGSWTVTVPAGTYTAGPSRDGTTLRPPGFKPGQRAVSVGTQDVAGVDFLAPSYTVSGTITLECGGTCPAHPLAISNAEVAFEGLLGTMATTDDKGHFEADVPNGTYTLAPHPGKAGLRYRPSTLQVAVNGAAVPKQDFTGCAADTTRATTTAIAHAAADELVFSNLAQIKTCKNFVSVRYTPGVRALVVTWEARPECSLARSPYSFDANRKPYYVFHKRKFGEGGRVERGDYIHTRDGGVSANIDSPDGELEMHIVIAPGLGRAAVELSNLADDVREKDAKDCRPIAETLLLPRQK